MHVLVAGAGPAGLYFALLAKQARPSWRIQVIERNRPDDTFGWGVVFSDETLGHFGQADPPTYAAITAAFAHWDDIEIVVKGERIRSTGHGFSGISRVHLLGLLQARCRELGVELAFQTEVEPVPEADLVVAADGINSRIRTALADVFRPELTPGRSPFIWLGCDRRLDTFTFLFRENEHGLYQVHAYPFSAERSTFIVETDAATLARAGLEQASEAESIAYLERLFAEDLGGARLLGNRSQWIRFRTVTNETWHAGNVVLLGDAAHTAHFSIGSGTKLAMEDAIALARHVTSGAPVAEALAAYQSERWLDVAKVQRAAKVSQEWFERAALMHARLPPLQLAASMLTRSKRVTHENLRRRDPALVVRLDQWFAGQAGVAERPPMFTPFRLRELTLANRVVVSPMCMYSATDGMPDDWHLVHLGSRAVGGAALVMAEMTDVSAAGRITHGCTGLYRDEHAAAWRRVVEFVHGKSAAKIGIQLGHAGRKASTRLPWEGGAFLHPGEGGWEIIAPSPIPYQEGAPVPREMTSADMDEVLAQYVAAARRAETAGFDLLELHMAHGYLLASFISPLTNQRTDAWGGDLAGRMRFPLAVLAAVRAVWPAHKPLSVRISAVDWEPGGHDADDAVEVARLLGAGGCDIVDVSTGQTTPRARPEYGRMYQAPFANLIRHAARIPTIAVGAIEGWDHVNTVIATGRADLCALARPHLRDPYLTTRAAIDQGWGESAWPPPYLPGKPRVA